MLPYLLPSTLPVGINAIGIQRSTEILEKATLGETVLEKQTPMQQIDHEYYMAQAYAQAQQALVADEVPVGAIIACHGQVIAAAHNGREQLRDPTAHAEMVAITQAAAALNSWRLEGCTLYVTLEPCPMCAGAILQARIPTLVYGASDPKAGAVDSLFQLLGDSRLNHRSEVIRDVMAEPCGQILSDFFAEKRKQRKK